MTIKAYCCQLIIKYAKTNNKARKRQVQALDEEEF